MELKKDSEGNPVFDDGGHPVYIDGDGRERGINVPDLFERVKALADERDELIESRKAAEGRLKKFKGLDPDEARKNKALVEAFGEKDLNPDNVRTQIAELTAERDGIRAELEEASSSLEANDKTIRSLTISNGIRSSKFVSERLIDAFSKNPERIEALYGSNFKVEGGKPVGYYPDGTKITVGGQAASIDEALEKLVTDKTMLRPDGASGGGGGGRPGDGRPSFAGKKHSEMSNAEKIAYGKEHGVDALSKLREKG